MGSSSSNKLFCLFFWMLKVTSSSNACLFCATCGWVVYLGFVEVCLFGSYALFLKFMLMTNVQLQFLAKSLFLIA